MLAQQKLGCFSPVWRVLPPVFDQARRVTVNLRRNGVSFGAQHKGDMVSYEPLNSFHT